MAAPLTKTDISNCQAGSYECGDLEREIEKAEACGLDCTEQKMRNQIHKKFYNQVLTNYSTLFQPAPH